MCNSLNSDLLAEVLIGQGILAVNRDELDLGEQLFRKALRLSQQRNLPFVQASALLNLSFAAVHRHHYDEAIDWSNQSSQLAHSLDFGIIEEKALGNLGWSYYQMGDLNRALELAQDAEARARALGILKDQVRWLSNIGAAYFMKEQDDQAHDYYQKALDLATAIEDQEQITTALSTLSSIAVEQKKLDLASEYSQKAFDLAHSRGDRVKEIYALFTQGQVASGKNRYDRAEKLFHEIVHDPNTDPPVLWRSRNELGYLDERRGRIREAQANYTAALDSLECARGGVGAEELRLSFLFNAGEIYENYLHFLIAQGEPEKALQLADYGRAQTLAEGLGLKSKHDCGASHFRLVSPQAASRSAHATVLFYWLGSSESYLWVVSPVRITLFKLPPRSDLEDLIRNYRKALLGPRDVAQTNNADGTTLYETLIGPAKKLIPNGSRVVIVPDGILNSLNFETLLVPGNHAHYWIEDATISYSSSLRMLAARRNNAHSNPGKLLLIGDPVVPDQKYPQLLAAGSEMKAVESAFPPQGTKVYTGKAATPLAYLQSDPEKYSYIHFVAHGTASQISPLDSAIILSKATAEDDSFKLHARDIVTRPLRADLVTISACFGSGSTIYDGEGLVGLSWGFIRAGAHNVVGALWAVSDQSTAQMMGQFYSGIKSGRPPQLALRDAKLSLLHSGTVFRKPIYWAPFLFYEGP